MLEHSPLPFALGGRCLQRGPQRGAASCPPGTPPTASLRKVRVRGGVSQAHRAVRALGPFAAVVPPRVGIGSSSRRSLLAPRARGNPRPEGLCTCFSLTNPRAQLLRVRPVPPAAGKRGLKPTDSPARQRAPWLRDPDLQVRKPGLRGPAPGPRCTGRASAQAPGRGPFLRSSSR